MGKVLLSAVALALTLVVAVSASTNAGPTWNQVADQYHFSQYPAAEGTTFAQNYSGNDLAGDFNGIMNAVSEIMARPIIPIGDDDILNSSLENWANPEPTN